MRNHIRLLLTWHAVRQANRRMLRFALGVSFAQKVMGESKCKAFTVRELENQTDTARMFNDYDDYDRGIDWVLSYQQQGVEHETQTAV